jgi:hypothetical protein
VTFALLVRTKNGLPISIFSNNSEVVIPARFFLAKVIMTVAPMLDPYLYNFIKSDCSSIEPSISNRVCYFRDKGQPGKLTGKAVRKLRGKAVRKLTTYETDDFS